MGFDAGLSHAGGGPTHRPGVPTGLWTEPERLAFQLDRAYREFEAPSLGRAGRHRAKVFTEMAALA